MLLHLRPLGGQIGNEKWKCGGQGQWKMNMGGEAGKFSLLPISISNEMLCYVVFAKLSCFYIADIVLGLEPWINASSTCSFESSFGVELPLTSTLHDFDVSRPNNNHEKPTQNKITSLKRKQLVAYEGTFGNFAYGNVTVCFQPIQLSNCPT